MGVRIMPEGFNHKWRFPHGSCAAARKVLSIQAKREIKWAFVGGMHANRRNKLLNFASEGEIDQFCMRVDAKHMFNVYANATFVPNVDGSNTECFRIYEAAIAGAIPNIANPRAADVYEHHWA